MAGGARRTHHRHFLVRVRGRIALADYLGAAYLTVGEVIHLDYSAYRNITRWLSNMKARPSWSQTVNEGFYAYFVAPFKDTAFVGL